MARDDTIKLRQSKLKKLLLDQLRRTPTIEQSCRKVGVTAMTVGRWRKASKTFDHEVEEALRDGRETMSDIAESHMFSQIGQGDPAMIRFLLARTNPRYGDKLELSGTVTAKAELTPEQKKQIREALRLSSVGHHAKPRKGKAH